MTHPISSIHALSNTVQAPACGLEHQEARARARELFRARAPRNTSLSMHLLYNWGRDLPALRGVTLRKRVDASSAEPLLWYAFNEALTQAEALLKSAVDDLNAVAAFARWAHLAKHELRLAYAKQLLALPDAERNAAATQTCLRILMAQTPHGAARGTRNTVKAHGEDTVLYFRAVLQRVLGAQCKHPYTLWNTALAHAVETLRLPDWALSSEFAQLAAKHPLLATPASVMEAYLTNHDCGKAFVLAWDATGRPHYLGHSERSAAVWRLAGGDNLAAQLMEKDMLLHTLKAEGVSEFAKDPLALPLLLAAVAEIHANAEPVFGGFESDSFKAKWKQLDRRGNAIVRLLLSDFGG